MFEKFFRMHDRTIVTKQNKKKKALLLSVCRDRHAWFRNSGFFWGNEKQTIPGKPGNAGGGKGPWFKADVRSGNSQEIGRAPINSGNDWAAADGVACQSEE
ncbi:MAG: hypothetical protein ABIK28_19115, partial [Planctomycetota bacterium]